jgi:hypothetical protein
MKTFGLILIAIVILLSGYYLFGARKSGVPVQIPVSPTAIVQKSSIKDQIILALSKKNNWDASRVELNVTTTEGDFAKGDVKFKDEMGGGLWFAAKVNDTWKIVYDGNGMITCDMLANYKNFPKNLIPQCLDKQTNKLVTR